MRNNFDAARLFFAIAVIFSHSYALAGVQEWTVYGHSLGNMAVHGFFVISGFLIAKSYVSTENVWSFAWKRLLRIAPALIVALIISRLAWTSLDHFAGNPIPYVANGPVWTLTWEVVCYATCAGLGLLGILTPGAFASFIACAWLAFILFSGDRSSTAVTVIAPLFMLFLGGSAIAVYEKKVALPKMFPLAFAVAAITCIPTVFSFLFDLASQAIFLFGPKVSEVQTRDLVYAAVVPIVVICACKYSKPIKIPVDISYGLYLYGWPASQVLVVLARRYGIGVTPMSLFATTLPLAALCAYLSWILVERPALMLKGRKQGQPAKRV